MAQIVNRALQQALVRPNLHFEEKKTLLWLLITTALNRGEILKMDIKRNKKNLFIHYLKKK